MRAKNLLDTDMLVCYNGNELKIDSVQIEYAENAVQTYNFEVEGNHNYYVGDNSILAHNQCTKLYRAMSDAEYGSLTKHGKFRPKAGTMNEKWMATSVDDAVTWGNKLNGAGNFNVVEIRVSTTSGMNYKTMLDGVGPAYSAHYKYLNKIMTGFTKIL